MFFRELKKRTQWPALELPLFNFFIALLDEKGMKKGDNRRIDEFEQRQ